MIVLADNVSITAHFEKTSKYANTVVINEINYNSSDTFNPDDWVELHNPHNDTLNISGWVFKDADNSHAFTFPPHTYIGPQSYLVICKDSNAFHSVFPEVSNYIGDINFGLSRNGDTVRIYSFQGMLVDSLTYDDDMPWPNEPDGEGPTLSLINPALDNSLPGSWAASKQYGTPGRVNSDIYRAIDEITRTVIESFSLGQNYPNPFNKATTIPISLPKGSRVSLYIHSIQGQLVERLIDRFLAGGNHTVIYNADNLASGYYLYTLKAGSFRTTKRMLLIK